MNYKLLANINYSIVAKDEINGILTVEASLENKRHFDDRLIVQDFDEEEEQEIFYVPMLDTTKEVEKVTIVVKKDNQEISIEESIEKAEKKLEKLFGATWELIGIKIVEEIELVYEEKLIVPPSNDIRKEILHQMGITNMEATNDNRDMRESHYDGSTDYNCTYEDDSLHRAYLKKKARKA